MILLKHPEDFMLPCLNKALFGIDCMGCGLQRSVVLIAKAQFVEAFKMYPAIYPLLLLVVLVLVHKFKPLKHYNTILTTFAVITVATIVVSFGVKHVLT